MSFTEHLAELRVRIIRSGIAIVVSFALAYLFSNQIFALIAAPLSPAGFGAALLLQPAAEEHAGPEAGGPAGAETTENAGDPAAAGTAQAEAAPVVPPDGTDKAPIQWTILNPLESIVVQIKLAIYTALVVSLPIILWQVCAFIFPGLHKTERRVVQVLIFGCSILATVGVLIAYFGVFPLVLPYLLQWVPEGVTIQLRMNETISIILFGLVGFAVAFQFPMAVLILVYMELLSPADLKAYRKLAIVGIAFLSAILTPPDPISMTIMMIPLILLYEGSIWVSYLVLRRRSAG